MDKKITRQMLIDEINKRHPETSAPTGNSFADRGNRERWTVANFLLRRLNRGINPTTQEVVGYFGKGARFEA